MSGVLKFMQHTSVLFSLLNQANMVLYIFEAVIDVKCQLVDI